HGPVSGRALPAFPTRRSSDLDVAAVCEHDAVCAGNLRARNRRDGAARMPLEQPARDLAVEDGADAALARAVEMRRDEAAVGQGIDRKSTRLNSCHVKISYAVF